MTETQREEEISRQAREVARSVLTKKYARLMPITEEMVDALAIELDDPATGLPTPLS